MNLLTNLYKKMAGGAKNALFALVVFAAAASGLAFTESGQGVLAAVTQTAAPFDGKAVYSAAFKALRDNHYTLVDPAARAAFTATWEHKHDNDGALATEKGTDLAVYEMMWSLGQRFDYYFPPEATKAEKQEQDATMAGIGLSLKEDGLVKAVKALGPKPTEAQVLPLLKLSDDRPLVAGDTPDDDTPAGLAHIEKGDRITAVDGKDVNGQTIDDVVKTIRGPVGTKVTLTVVHKDDSGKLTTTQVVLTRAKITLHVVKTDVTGRIYHIRLSNFMSQFGTPEMGNALQNAVKNHASSIILDLRGNPGGDLGQVLQMAQMFIDHGVLLKQVERDGDHMITITYSVEPGKFVMTAQSDDGSAPEVREGKRIPVLVPNSIPVIVLTDEGSASASEILSGTLQANGRARVMGQPTYGKGVGQVVVDLPSERRMHVTTFEFFPGGVKMDWVGIVPDIEVKLPADADIVDDPSQDTQLKAAQLELINTAIGNPTPARAQADIDARRAELEKTHKDNFQKEVQQRQEMLKKAAADKSDSTTIGAPTKPTAEPHK